MTSLVPRALSIAAVILLVSLGAPAAQNPLPLATPEEVGLSAEQLQRIDAVMKEALDRSELPGAVVVVVHRGKVVFRKAYGQRQLRPEAAPMTVEVVFDLASLTKPIATATAIWMLIEQGKVRLDDPVATYLTEFGGERRKKITVRHLLLHTSGLIADNPLSDYKEGREKARERVLALEPKTEPGERFVYSDMGFILLGEIVERVSGRPLNEFAKDHIFTPLGMNETTFRPEAKLKDRAAPTTFRDGKLIAGTVHDPRSAILGGVAGHAGLFSTVDDLAVYAQMILNGGEYNGRRILRPETVRRMTEPHEVATRAGKGLRSLAWDVDTSYSKNRGETFKPGEGFGHTGFTGTSIWIEPKHEMAVIFLSNRVHPDEKGNVTRLRGQVATLAAASLRQGDAKGVHPVATGVDVLVRENFRRLKGRRVGLITNHTGKDRDGRSTIDLLHQAEGVNLVALFSPEHGIRGAVDEKVADDRDTKTGLPIYSLYGKRRQPDTETLKGIDTVVYDIQDAGCRFYTYISTLGLALEAAARHKVKVVVLDRPNPIGGVAVAGPVLDPKRESFIAYHPLPIRHGLTVGELALLFNKERGLGADLEVVRMEGWRRGDLFDRTGLLWVQPSPNLRTLTAALLYPGIGLLETTNVSVGRGTERPFEWFGAPWIDGRKLAGALAAEGLPGVRFVPMNQMPVSSVHRGKVCGGVNVVVDDWERFEPLRTGLTVAMALKRLYPKEWQFEKYDALLRHADTMEALRRGTTWEELEKMWRPELERYRERRNAFLLYPS
jgi:uncharacterized protein YbbC (DUF1343 family)/CubicO group peptidase (beta-lactamase class C family)